MGHRIHRTARAWYRPTRAAPNVSDPPQPPRRAAAEGRRPGPSASCSRCRLPAGSSAPPSLALRRPPDPGCRWIGPEMGISKRGASAGKHEDEGVEQERAPGRMQRGAHGMDCSELGGWGEGSRRGHTPRGTLRTGRATVEWATVEWAQGESDPRPPVKTGGPGSSQWTLIRAVR